MLAAQIPSADHAYGSEADTLILELTSRYVDPHSQPDARDSVGPRAFLNGFYDLIDLVSPHAKAKMSELLCRSRRTPRAVAHYLSLEPIDIGGDMLLHSPVLGKLDLLRISHAGEAEHRALIAKRSSAQTAALQTFSTSDYEKPEQERCAPDNNVTLLNAAARGGRLPHVEADQAPVAPLVDATPVQPQAESSLALPKAATALPERMARSAFRRTLNEAALDGDIDAVHALLDARFGLGSQIIERVMNDACGDAFAVLMKSDDSPASDVHRAQMMLFETIANDMQAAARAMRIYAALTVDECQASVETWLESQPRMQSDAPVSQHAAVPAPRRASHAEAAADRHVSEHAADRPAQNAIEHRRYAF